MKLSEQEIEQERAKFEVWAAADCPDGLRYKALGNSMAVPVMRWIGMRMLAHVGGGV